MYVHCLYHHNDPRVDSGFFHADEPSENLAQIQIFVLPFPTVSEDMSFHPEPSQQFHLPTLANVPLASV